MLDFYREMSLDVSAALQSHTGKYRGLQGNPCNENRIPAMRTGLQVMKTVFFLQKLTYREFFVSSTKFGFAVRRYGLINGEVSVMQT